MKPKPGDLFSVQIAPNEFAFGRVMLNIQDQCVKAGLIRPDNPLSRWPEGVALVEIYAETSAGALPDFTGTVIPGVFIPFGFLVDGLFATVGFTQVDPHELEFPEALSIKTISEAQLIKGELKIPMAGMGLEEVEAIDVTPATIPTVFLAEYILYAMGRKDDIHNPVLVDKELRNLNRYDLRFSDHRAEVFAAAGLDPDESYYELSKRMGFDLARFY